MLIQFAKKVSRDAEQSEISHTNFVFLICLRLRPKGISLVTTEMGIRVLTERNYKLLSYFRQVQRMLTLHKARE